MKSQPCVLHSLYSSRKSIRINGNAAIEKSFDTPKVTECLLLDGRFGTQLSAVAYIVVNHGSVVVKWRIGVTRLLHNLNWVLLIDSKQFNSVSRHVFVILQKSLCWVVETAPSKKLDESFQPFAAWQSFSTRDLSKLTQLLSDVWQNLLAHHLESPHRKICLQNRSNSTFFIPKFYVLHS